MTFISKGIFSVKTQGNYPVITPNYTFPLARIQSKCMPVYYDQGALQSESGNLLD